MDINIGFAFGLFAVFAILRYRTDPIPIKEMTYLFIAIAIGVINALSGANKESFDVLLFTNITLVVLTYLLEMYWQRNSLVVRTVEYEIIENIKFPKQLLAVGVLAVLLGSRWWCPIPVPASGSSKLL